MSARDSHASMIFKLRLTDADRPVSTPGEDVNGNDEDEPELNKHEEVKSFRADGASSNCSCMVRPNLQFSAKGDNTSHV